MSLFSFLNPLSDKFLGGPFNDNDDDDSNGGGGGSKPTFYDPLQPYQKGGLIDNSAYEPLRVTDYADERRRYEQAAADATAAQRGSDAALAMLRAQATGQAPSVAQLAADAQRRQMIAAAASQAASGLGAYSPARQRAAAMGLGVGLGQLGGQTAAAIAQERLKAQQLYADAQRQRYAQELAAEQARRGQSMGLLGMWSHQQEANRAAREQANRDRIGLATGQQQTQAGMYNADKNRETQQDIAVLNAAASAAASAGGGGGK